MRRVGVLLAGCGVHDGSDVQESVLLAQALLREGMRPVYLAPDVAQRNVVDHATGNTDGVASARSVVSEAARIARGVVRVVGEIASVDLDAVIIPGGAGVVENLCEPGERPLGGGPLRADVKTLLDDLMARRAPVAAIGLAEVVVARHRDRALDQGRINLSPREVVVDDGEKTLFTPGFMGGESLVEVSEGIGRLVLRLADMMDEDVSGAREESS